MKNKTDVKQQYNSGRIDTISYTSPLKKTKADLEKEIEKRRVRDAELVVCRFKNLENPGRSVTFNYRRYKGQIPEKYYFMDGEVYQIPRGVRNWIKGLHTPVYEHIMDGDNPIVGGFAHKQYQRPGMPTMQIKKKLHRFMFLDLDYMEDMDDEVTGSNILEVTYADTGVKA